MNDEETEVSAECAIYTFSVGNITSSVITKKYDSAGNASDTIVQRTIGGTSIFFNIDQKNGHIYTVDSLPNWVDLSKVVPTFTNEGNVYVKWKGDDNYYYVTSGSDSINFNNTVELWCNATDGVSSKRYLVDIYRHTVNIDTLEWKGKTSNLAITCISKAFSVGDKVFVFATDGAGNDCASSADVTDPTTWSAPATIPVNASTVVLHKGAFYGLGGDGYVYRSTPEQVGSTWTLAADSRQMVRLLAADDYYVYAYDGQGIVGSPDIASAVLTDTVHWTEQGTRNINMLPETNINSFNYPSRTNSKLQTVVMTGITSQNTSKAVTWCKQSSSDSIANQQWDYIASTGEEGFQLPRFGNLTTAYYQGALYAFGLSYGEYGNLFTSDDNGITWKEQTSKYMLPADLKGANGAAGMVAVGTQLWIIQENGQIWVGSLR